jgi:prophage regulatory protein
MSATPNPRTILRKEEVLRRTGLKTTRLYELIKSGEFPAQVSIGARAVGWYATAVQNWIDVRPAAEARRGQSGGGGISAQNTQLPSRRPSNAAQTRQTTGFGSQNGGRPSVENANECVNEVGKSSGKPPKPEKPHGKYPVSIGPAKEHPAALPDGTREDAPDQSPKTQREYQMDRVSASKQDSGDLAPGVCNADEFKRLKMENARLKVLLANAMLENDALKAAMDGMSAA